MILREILTTKGSTIFTTTPDATLERVVELLVEHNCGSLVVVGTDRRTGIVGIITERDIMRSCAAGLSIGSTAVADVMTTEVITGSVEDSIAHTMGVMTERRIRHLPVFDGEELAGLISIGDVVKAEHQAVTAENHHLKNYILS